LPTLNVEQRSQDWEVHVLASLAELRGGIPRQKRRALGSRVVEEAIEVVVRRAPCSSKDSVERTSVLHECGEQQDGDNERGASSNIPGLLGRTS
jgi:hypothetical protein